MTGLTEFLTVFGDITIADVITLLMILGFGLACYKKAKNFFEAKIKAEERKEKIDAERDENIKRVMEEVAKYPTYRSQSVNIQRELEEQINSLREAQETQIQAINRLEDSVRKREKNKLYSTLLRHYNYYCDPEKNPKQAWTEMESIAFWGLFEEYEEAHGDGYIHSVVEPAMRILTVVKMDDVDGIAELARSRK